MKSHEPAACDLQAAIHPGWLPLAVRLCEQVDHLLGPDKNAFQWVQFKEKLGSARFQGFWRGPVRSPALKDAVADAINQAVLTSARTCIVCGAAAPISEPDVPLCADHEAWRPDRRWAPVVVRLTR